jgi:hypothetical protein
VNNYDTSKGNYLIFELKHVQERTISVASLI